MQIIFHDAILPQDPPVNDASLSMLINPRHFSFGWFRDLRSGTGRYGKAGLGGGSIGKNGFDWVDNLILEHCASTEQHNHQYQERKFCALVLFYFRSGPASILMAPATSVAFETAPVLFRSVVFLQLHGEAADADLGLDA